MFKNNVGIWGYGIVGKSVIRFLKQNYPEIKIALYDKKSLSPDDQLLTAVTFYAPEELDSFLQNNAQIIPSPGIDLRPYAPYKDKFIHEVDLFCALFKKPIITITGTVGKTTITQVTSDLLRQNGLRVATGGNIGTALLDLVPHQENVDLAVIELSSFQLEYAQKINPAIAVLTNLYPNHLDRHGDMHTYLEAKLQSMHWQEPGQKALIPQSLYKDIKHLLGHRALLVHSDRPLTAPELAERAPEDTLYFCDKSAVWRHDAAGIAQILKEIPEISYPINWVIMAAICDQFNRGTAFTAHQITLPAHRLDHIVTFNNCAFFDDSKATIMQATQAAVNKLADYDVVLLLGGTSKGVDRSAEIPLLKQGVKRVVCFGAEATELMRACHAADITATQAATLEQACAAAYQAAQQYRKPAILLSPGGASFDLFTDYKARGSRFKELVYAMSASASTEKS